MREHVERLNRESSYCDRAERQNLDELVGSERLEDDNDGKAGSARCNANAHDIARIGEQKAVQAGALNREAYDLTDSEMRRPSQEDPPASSLDHAGEKRRARSKNDEGEGSILERGDDAMKASSVCITLSLSGHLSWTSARPLCADFVL